MKKNKETEVTYGIETKKSGRERARMFARNFRRDWQLWLLAIVPAVYMLIFHYGPIYGVQIAFRNYRPRAGITGSEWVGLKWFVKFLTNYNFSKIYWNTFILSLYGLAVDFPLAVLVALLLNIVRHERLKKSVQTIIYMPHFISMVVMVAIFKQFFSPVTGFYGAVYRALGGVGYPRDFRGINETFRHIYVWTGVWQNLGWSTVIYVAALSAVSQEQHEAAMIDGANRWQRLVHVDFPAIVPTVCINLILSCGGLISVGFEKVLLLQTTMNLDVSEVISTYTYKVGLGSGRDYSYGAAIGLFNSVINCALLLLVNWISKKMTDNEVSLV